MAGGAYRTLALSKTRHEALKPPPRRPLSSNVEKTVSWRWFAVGAVATAALVVACGSAKPGASDGASSAMTAVGTPGDVLRSGPCSVEGETAACHVQTGRSGPIVNCFSGTQICQDGVWSECGAAAGGGVVSSIRSPEPPLEDHGGIGIREFAGTAPSRQSAGCLANPCNPDCQGIDIDAGTLNPGSFVAVDVSLAASAAFSMLPTPKTQANSLLCSKSASSTTQCSYDMCCDGTGATGTCQAWPDQTTCGRCNGVDYQVAVGCVDDNGHTRTSICNRGTADSPTSGNLKIIALPANPPLAGDPAICQKWSTTPQGQCNINLAKQPIKAGECIDMDFTVPGDGITCTGNFTTGNRALMINDQWQQPECNVCNNFSFNYTQQPGCKTYSMVPPPPYAETNVYKVKCLPGFRVEWNQLAYATDVPSTSEVFFSVRTAPRYADAGIGAFGPSVLVAHPANPSVGDPALCPMSGPSPCPKSLYTALGKANAGNEILELVVNMVPGSQIPVVRSWNLSFSCVPDE